VGTDERVNAGVKHVDTFFLIPHKEHEDKISPASTEDSFRMDGDSMKNGVSTSCYH